MAIRSCDRSGSHGLIAMGRIHASFGHPRRLGSTALAVLPSAVRPTLFTARPQFAPPLAIRFDNSEASRPALDLAARLNAPDCPPLQLLVAGSQADQLAGPPNWRVQRYGRMMAPWIGHDVAQCRE